MNTHDLDFVPPSSEVDIRALGGLLSHAFGFPGDDYGTWFARAGHENVRVLKRGLHVCGGLLEIPMAQYFGGRSVSTMGVAGVGIAPEERGKGLATRLMVSMLREARSRGFALSTLYPASVILYRRSGYERAGARFVIEIDPRVCEIEKAPGMTIAELIGTPDDVVALYTEVAQRCNGYIDRGPYVWSRVSSPRGLLPKVFGVSHGGKLEGYVAAANTAAGGLENKITVTDLAATTARAARAILRLLCEYRSVATSVTWNGGITDVFTNSLPERHADISLADYFMVRIVDVARAFTLRGWPRAASGSIAFDVTDTSMPESSGRYGVTLQDGRATVETSPTGPTGPIVRISERGLAALYTGHVDPHTLVELGWLEADGDALARLVEWFAGPAPTMRDFF